MDQAVPPVADDEPARRDQPVTVHGLTDWIDRDNTTLAGRLAPVLYFGGHLGETMEAGPLREYVAHLQERLDQLPVPGRPHAPTADDPAESIP